MLNHMLELHYAVLGSHVFWESGDSWNATLVMLHTFTWCSIGLGVHTDIDWMRWTVPLKPWALQRICPPVGAALSAVVLSRSSRHGKGAGFTHAVTLCRLRLERWRVPPYDVRHASSRSLCCSPQLARFATAAQLLCGFALEPGQIWKETLKTAKGWHCQSSRGSALKTKRQLCVLAS